MKTTITRAALAVAAIAVLGSCAKQEYKLAQTPMSEQAIEVRSYNGNSSTQLTKAAIYGTTMPIDRDIYLSAYFNEKNAESGVKAANSQNYFTGLQFSYNSSKQSWVSAGEPVYWPLTGNLDFLAYSSEEALTAAWNETNCAKEVELSGFKDAESYNDDVLFASANKQIYTTTGVPMEFKHAKSFLVFTAKASYADAITITKIEVKVKKIQEGSTKLIVTNDAEKDSLGAKWTGLAAAANISVPGTTGTYSVPTSPINVHSKVGYCGIGGQGMMIPQQEMTSFTVYFDQKAPGANGKTISQTFTYNCQTGVDSLDTDIAPTWEMGKRYIYDLVFTVNEIAVNASIEEWNDEEVPGEQEKEVDIPEAANFKMTAVAGDTTLPVLHLAKNTKVVIDWDDNSVPDEYTYEYTKTSSQRVKDGNLTASHKYAAGGEKNIKIYVSEKGKVSTDTLARDVFAAFTVRIPELFEAKTYGFVDLGVVVNGKKILFAEFNLGANTPWENGDYYAWGATAVNYTLSGTTFTFSETPADQNKTATKYYQWDASEGFAGCNAPYYNNASEAAVKYTKYLKLTESGFETEGDGLNVLLPEDDAAYVASNGAWRMPTKEEFDALRAATTNEWVTTYKGQSVKGRVFKGQGEYVGKEIFLPAAGYGGGTSLSGVGSGYYWLSSLYAENADYAQCLYFGSGYVYTDGDGSDRFGGCSVRPVSE